MDILNQNEKDEDIIRKIPESKENYLPLDKDRLALFTVNFLEVRNIEPTFDKIVVTAFKLFPEKFSLIGFPEYPDAKVVHDSLWHCTYKTKRWISGNVQSGFKITEKGKYFLEETKKILEGKIKLTKTHTTIPRRKEITFINMLKKTEAYKKYLQNKKNKITKSEIFETLKATQNSRELAETHLTRYIEYANRVNETSVIQFLEFAKKKLRGNKNA